MTFDHRERLQLSLVSPTIIDVTLTSTSVLSCVAVNDCLSLISPMRGEVLRLFVDNPSLNHLRWETSSHSSTSLTLLSANSSPSGVSVVGSFDDATVEIDHFSRLIGSLQDNRLLLSPLGSMSQKRLHRHIINHGGSFRVNLPMEGSGFTSEAVQANLPPCGLFALGDSDLWSSYLVGSHQDVAHSPRRLWMIVSKVCSNDACTIVLEQGLQYGMRWREPSLKLSRLLPGNAVLSCPWTSETSVEVISPTSVDITFPSEYISEDTGRIRKTTLPFPSSIAEPFLTVQNGGKWIDFSYGRIDKTIHRPQGMAHVGRLETSITNDDVYEAHLSLFDILPAYVRITSLYISCDAVRSYHPIHPDSTLLQHQFILPPQSSVRLTIGYDPVLLPFQRFPPDPNRGMELPPSWVVWNSTHTLYSPSLLLLPPVPDMSMPFNIISLTCTLYAFVIGSIINTIVRRGDEKVYFQLHPDESPKTTKQKLQEKLRKIRQKFFARKDVGVLEAGSGDKQAHDGDASESDNWVREAKLVGDASDVPFLLTQGQRQSLSSLALPMTVANRSWKRLYSLERDGDCFETFLTNVVGEAETVLVVRTTHGHLLGAYADNVWERRKDYYGSGKACLFTVEGEKVKIYPWTGANRLVQHIDAAKGRIIMGAGDLGGIGFCVDENFSRGSTARSETFENEPLCPDPLFEVEGFEVYGFVHGAL